MDAEWGIGMRLDDAFSFPYNMTLGAVEDNDLIFKVGSRIGSHANRLGVHINFAPVVDVNTNPDNPIIGFRSFGEDKFNVAEKALSYMKGMQSKNLLGSAKHFPGHGDTKTDSHLTLPLISFSQRRIDSVELYPFKKLINNNFISIGPDSGEQACGDEGFGRMSEPQQIINQIASSFSQGLLAGKKILITAGPTREKIDPVRYISNRSSGKMGFSIAEAARDAGGLVSIISGPVNLETPNEVERINVESADEMLKEVDKAINNFDLFISTAAVSDFKPEEYENQKIKKQKKANNLNLELIKNQDILKSVSENKGDLKVIGFAAETQNIIENAKKKLKEKNLDLIIANDVSDDSIGFDSDENEVYLITKKIEKKISKISKKKLSRNIIEFIAENL